MRDDLRIKISLIPDLTVTMAGNHALMLEQHSKKKPAQSSRHSYTKNSETTYPRNPNAIVNSKTKPNSEVKGKSVTPNKDIVCFKCHEHGHYRRACPNNREFTMLAWNEIRKKEMPKTILVII